MFARGFVESGIFFCYNLVGAVDGFLEEVFEFYGISGAGFDGFSVFSEDGSKPGVPEFGFFVSFCVEPFFYGGEEVFKVVLLAAVGDVDDFVGFGVFCMIEDGCEVGG